MTERILIRNIEYWSPDGTVVTGDLAIAEGKFAHVGTVPEDWAADRIMEGKDLLAMPGFINTHTHAGMIPFRSLGDDTPDRLTRFLFPLESQAMTAELAYHSTKVAIAEMQLAGITTFYDMYYFEESVAEATAEMNSRAILAETVLEDGCDSDEKFGGLKIAEEFIKNGLIIH